MLSKQDKAAAKRLRKFRTTILNHPSNTPMAKQLKAAVIAGRL